MKILLAASLLILLVAPTLRAEEYIFQYERFGATTLHTDKGKEFVRIEESGKEGPVTTLFKSGLKPRGRGVYATMRGTVFTLGHLPRPITNDGNRHINSGDWKLTVSGQGEEFTRLKPKMPVVAFGDTPPLVYLGAENRTHP